MKKIARSSKLSLSTETLLPLTTIDLDGARGGFAQKTENCTNTSIPCGQTRPTRVADGGGEGGGGDFA
jgi:hypothetical protein